jgi:phosphohistidine phosphatase SixA
VKFSVRLARLHFVATIALCCVIGVACDKKKPVPPTPPPDRPRPAAPAPAPNPNPEVTPPAPSGPSGSFADDAALIKALRAGGYIIAIRHAHTDMTQKDTQGDDYSDCTKQRNLDEQGRADARAIGEAFKVLALPIGDVYASPYCRTRETANLIFGRCTINPACMGETPQAIAARAVILGAKPPEGKDTVIVSHKDSLAKSTGSDLATLGEGGALIILPKGGNEFEVVHTISLEDWARLAEAARSLK